MTTPFEREYVWIEGRQIKFRCSDMNHPAFSGRKNWRKLSGASLWGIIRKYKATTITFTATNPVGIQIYYGKYQNQACQVDEDQFMFFLDQLCEGEHVVRQSWKEFGF